MRLTAFVAVAALLLGGCAGTHGDPTSASSTSSTTSSSATNHTLAKAPPTIAKAADLSVLTGAIPVSIAGHRTSEFTVARDPSNRTHLIASGMDWDSADGTVQCAAFASKDAGASWTQSVGLPGHTGTKEDTDPWVAIDGKGRAYLTCTEAGVGILLGQSTDGGATWQTAAPVPTGPGPAKDALGAFDDGNLFLCYQQGSLNILHSTDRGATWKGSGFPDIQAGCDGVVRGPKGDLYVAWQGGGQLEADNLNPAPPAYGIAASHDGGQSWQTVTLDTDLGTAPPNMQYAPQAAAPSIAVSNLTGTLFIAAQKYQNAEVAGGVSTGSQTFATLKRSRDQGKSFEDVVLPHIGSSTCAPVEQGTTPPCNQVHPTITVDDGGRLVLQMMLSDSQSLRKEVWMTVSADEGENWLPAVQLAATDSNASYAQPGNFVPDPQAIAQDAQDIAADPTSAPGAASAVADHETWSVFHRDGGEYFGIAATPEHVVDLWVQHDSNGKNVILAKLVKIL